MTLLRSAIIVHGIQPVNAIVLPADASAAAAYCANFDGVCVVRDSEDEYGTEWLTLTGCLAVEVTGMDPMPGLGSGWSYVDGEWVAPPAPEQE
jgi:hypothetical protein